jgi:alkylation response protein AidB-like acyl-CoA dehydrogenase
MTDDIDQELYEIDPWRQDEIDMARRDDWEREREQEESAKRRTLTRTDEAGFRVAVPREVGGLTILAVSRYAPGGTGFYASAIAVAEGDPGGFSTHWLVYNDEHDHWDLLVGHYLFDTRQHADEDAAERVMWG